MKELLQNLVNNSLKSNLGFYERARRLEEENKRLKQLLSTRTTPDLGTPTPTSIDSNATTPHFTKQEETIKAYETRIKALERVLQEKYHSRDDEIVDKDAKTLLIEERRTTDTLRGDILTQKHEMDKMALQLHEEREKRIVAENNSKEFQNIYQKVFN